MNTDKVAQQIATLRKSKGLTQSELGERVGVSFQAYFVTVFKRFYSMTPFEYLKITGDNK